MARVKLGEIDNRTGHTTIIDGGGLPVIAAAEVCWCGKPEAFNGWATHAPELPIMNLAFPDHLFNDYVWRVEPSQ